MVLRDEQADILGGPILQRPESGVLATFSQYRLVFKLATLFGLGLLVWIACARGLEHLKKHRELRYRKAMRRKHGIPDSDCRPFAVAYAAAKRAHLEREAQDRKKTTNYVSEHNSPAVDQRTHAPKDTCVLRKRVPETIVQLGDNHSPRKHDDSRRPEIHALNFADRYNPNPRRRVVVSESSPVKWPSVHCAGRKEPVITLDDNEESKKRSFEDESDVEHETIKKSRIDADEGAERADWYAQYSDSASQQRAPMGSLDRQPEGHHMNGQERFKLVDDIRNEGHESDEAMEGIDEDKVTELKAVARGKKRDRAEAGSTFGGDDDEDIRNERASHHRKRRTISRRKMEPPARGQKRDREVESPESEGEGVDCETSGRRGQRSSKKKKGKKAASDEVIEVSADDPRISKDVLCSGRRIGDKWEVDGVQYKVGEKGERLRLTLVKKAKSKYHMPQDSQHPDRSAALEIYVETWMTEEQYKEAEVQHELAWQEASTTSSGSRGLDILDSPTKNGKSLLWDSVQYSSARRPFRQFIPSGSSTRINPFEQRQSQPTLGRRVASSSVIVSPLLPGVAESPTRPGFRGFSKWEKQDREAEAMARIRAKIEEQKKTQASEIPTLLTVPGLETKPSSVPTITITPAPAATAEGKVHDNTLQSKSNIPTFSCATPPSTNNSIKDTTSAASTATPTFSSIPAIVPSSLFPNPAPIPPTATPSAVTHSPFSFAKPPQAPSSMLPNIFGKGTGAGVPSFSAPSPSALGATTQPQLSATESISKPALFSFTKSDVPSSPAVVISSTTNSEVAPMFNATSISSSSPVTFGFYPAATKAETSVPVSTSAAISESSKPTAPLFSFSGAFPSSSTPTLATSSAPSAPKFSFGQPSTISTPTPSANQVTGTAPQPKPTFKFGQPGATTVVSATDESKKSAVPVPTSGTAAGSNEPAKPSPFGLASASGSSTFTSASAMNLFGKPATLDSGSSTPIPVKPTPAAAPITNSTVSSTLPGALATGSAPAFSFGGINSSFKSTDGSKSAPLFEGIAGGSIAADGPKPVSTFGSNTESSTKPSSAFGSLAGGVTPPFAFGASEVSKPASVLNGTVEGLKPTFPFSSGTESKPTTSPAAGSSKPTSLFAIDSNISSPSNAMDISKPTPTSGFGILPSASSFTFGKQDDAAANTPTPTGPQAKPATSFAFGAPSSVTSSIFGQPSAFAASGESSLPAFGKPTNATPSTFGFSGTGTASLSSTFTFGKPTAQNQKQEQ